MATKGDIGDIDAVSAGAENAENEICEESTEVQEAPFSPPPSFEEELQKCAFVHPFWEHLKRRGYAIQREQYKVIYDAYMGGDLSRLTNYIMTLEDGTPLSKEFKEEIKKHGLSSTGLRHASIPDFLRKINPDSSSYPGYQIACKMFFSKAFAQLGVVFGFVYFIMKGREGNG